MEDIPGLSPEQMRELADKGHLDQVYLQLEGQKHEEVKQAAAGDIAKDIQTNPDAADVAQRVYAALNPTPPPSAAPAPDAAPQPQSAPVAALPPEPQPTATPPPSPEAAPPQEEVPQGAPAAQQPAAAQTVQAPGAVDPKTLVRAGNDAAMQSASTAAQNGSVQGVYEAIQSGLTLQQQAALLEAKAAEHGSKVVAGMYQQAANNLGAQAADVAKKNDTMRQMQTEQLQRMSSAIEQFNTVQIDPNRYWGQMSTPQRITAGIGMILSAAGGGHKAMDVINDAIHEDIVVQQANAELQLKGLGARATVLGAMHQVAGDIDDAAKLAQASMLDQVKLRIDAAAQGVAGDQAQANLLKTMGEIDLKKAQLISEVASKPQFAIQAMTNGQGAGTPAALGATPLDMAPTLPHDFNSMTLPEAQQKNFVPGIGLARDEKAAAKIADNKAAFDDILSSLKDLRDMRGRTGVSWNPYGIDRKKAQGLIVGVYQQLYHMYSNRGLYPGEFEMLSQIIPKDPLGPNVSGNGPLDSIGKSVYGDQLMGSIDQFEKRLRTSYGHALGTDMLAVYPNIKAQIRGQDLRDSLQKAPGSQ